MGPSSSAETIALCLYAVRNHEGKWFRSKGRDGYGSTWVGKLS